MARYDQRVFTRREALATIGGSLVSLAGCRLDSATGNSNWSNGRIVTRPSAPTITPPTGVTNIPLGLGLEGMLFVPATYTIIVPQLRSAGYSVDYREWDGGHGVSAALLEQSVDWFVRPSQ